MPARNDIAFAVFFACCVASFWFLGRVRNALKDRHFDLYVEVNKPSIFFWFGLQKFVCSDQHKILRDPDLSQKVAQCRWLFAVAFGAWLVVCLGFSNNAD